MDNLFERSVSIAKFMGWEIIESEVDEKRPEHRWFMMEEKGVLGGWSSSRGLDNSSENYEKELKKLKTKFWEHLCNSNYGQCGQYHKSYFKLIPVVEKLESMGFILNSFGLNKDSGCYYTVITKDDEKLSFISNDIKYNRLESMFMVVSDTVLYLENNIK